MAYTFFRVKFQMVHNLPISISEKKNYSGFKRGDCGIIVRHRDSECPVRYWIEPLHYLAGGGGSLIFETDDSVPIRRAYLSDLWPRFRTPSQLLTARCDIPADVIFRIRDSKVISF